MKQRDAKSDSQWRNSGTQFECLLHFLHPFSVASSLAVTTHASLAVPIFLLYQRLLASPFPALSNNEPAQHTASSFHSAVLASLSPPLLLSSCLLDKLRSLQCRLVNELASSPLSRPQQSSVAHLPLEPLDRLSPGAIPFALFHQAASLLCSSGPSLYLSIQLLCRLSTVCSEWHDLVYRDRGNSERDFWSSFDTISIVPSEHQFSIAGRVHSTRVVPAAVSSLRLVRSLLMRFGRELPLGGVVIIERLVRYTRLVSLDLDLGQFVLASLGSQQHVDVQKALNAALAHFASGHKQLTALALHCLQHIHPAANILRHLCSSVKHLSLSANQLLLMAWAADPLFARVWKTHSVESYAICARDYLSKPLVVTTLATALPSCTHLSFDHGQGASSMNALLWRLGGRLTFLRAPTASLLQLPSVAPILIALTSLSIVDSEVCGWSAGADQQPLRLPADQLPEPSGIDCHCSQARCVARTSLCVPRIPPSAAALAPTFLPHAAQNGTPPWPLYTILTPHITHLALVLGSPQPVSLLQSINFQTLPHLTHCHVNSIVPSMESNRSWDEARTHLSQELGNAWCEREDDVVRWRADRIWKRSVGLPDAEDQYKAYAD